MPSEEVQYSCPKRKGIASLCSPTLLGGLCAGSPHPLSCGFCLPAAHLPGVLAQPSSTGPQLSNSAGEPQELPVVLGESRGHQRRDMLL